MLFAQKFRTVSYIFGIQRIAGMTLKLYISQPTLTKILICYLNYFHPGFSPTLCKLDDLDFFGPVGYNLSYIRWFVEALFEKEALRYPDVDRPIRDRIAFPDHYTLDGNYSFCLGMIVVMAAVFRLIALFFLLFTNRGKQQ
jgi:hypothetical protein